MNADHFSELCERAISAAAGAIQDAARAASTRRSSPLAKNDLDNAVNLLRQALDATTEARDGLRRFAQTISPAPRAGR